MWRCVGCRVWDVGSDNGVWDVDVRCEVWDVGCGMWDVGRNKISRFYGFPCFLLYLQPRSTVSVQMVQMAQHCQRVLI